MWGLMGTETQKTGPAGRGMRGPWAGNTEGRP